MNVALPQPAPSADPGAVVPPAPRATAEQAFRLRKDLEASGWGVDAVAHLLGEVGDAALRREVRLPALRALRAAMDEDRAAGARPSPPAVLTALFMLGEPVLAAELDHVLSRTRTRGAAATGLVSPPDTNGRVRALVDLRPHEARDDTGQVRWWVASDLGEMVTGRELAPGHVLGIGGAGLTLAGLVPRTPVGTALDLGCGCGIQTLYLLRHAEHVTATDVSRRALDFTAFNVALAGQEERVELAAGSLLEPVAGRRFDLVVSNPPFVLTPAAVREAGLALMEYRDAGEDVLPGLVAGLGAHLQAGGTAVLLGNWEHHQGRDWRRDVADWLPEEADAWVVEREQQDPVSYAAMWLRDGGVAPERAPEAFDAAVGAWVGDFEERGVEGVGFGYLVLHRPQAPRRPWRVLEEVTTAVEAPLGPHVAQVLEAQDLLAGLDDDAVATLHPVLAADVTEERHLVPGAAEPSVIMLRQGGGLGRAVPVSTAVAALAGAADGELSVAQVAQAVAVLTGAGTAADAVAVRAELVAGVRELARCGFLTFG
ncbi:DUF7059 domain-containing protein [Actinomyces wuliandei]|uniref:DUF7059 domain-containing protein n=1 Tax=Actinomyces wuliandei TaxID=2057743 RepID=UPI001119178A|nr:methyltransferase [Actinomyces wuliandei]